MSDILTKIQKYAELKQQIKDLEKQIEVLATDVASEIAVEYDGRFESELGTFQIQMRKVWEFSPAVTEIEEEVKKQKKLEKFNGTAKIVDEKPILIYKTPKK